MGGTEEKKMFLPLRPVESMLGDGHKNTFNSTRVPKSQYKYVVLQNY